MFLVVNNRSGDIVRRFRRLEVALSFADALTDTQAWIDGSTFGVRTSDV